ncbi:hypothetical protein GOODEAATRI_033857 [Goodea atripinnis]|uniref:Uncharacterized protein n=1 Tax=Goodea atripinnis TaxID=208336 RepID=A0ABV0P9V8_9TELE
MLTSCGCPSVLDPIPARFLVAELTCMNTRCLLRTEVPGWQRADSSFLKLSCDRTLLTLHHVHLPSRSARTHHAVPSSSSSWIKPSDPTHSSLAVHHLIPCKDSLPSQTLSSPIV